MRAPAGCVLGCVVLLAGAVVLPAGGRPRVAQEPATTSGPAEEAYRANNRGVAALEQFLYEDAAKAFRGALAIDDGNLLARTNLAIALSYVPDHPAAVREAQAVLARSPDSPHAHYVLGLVARAENRVEDGIRAFSRVLAIDAGDVGARVNLGQIFLQQRKYEDAVAMFRTAVESEPYNVTAAYNLGVALTRGGREEEGQRAIATFQALRESGYGTTFSNNYLDQGRYAEALVSTGLEPGLVERADPRVVFTRLPLLPAETGGTPRVGDHLSARAGHGLALADVNRDGALDLLTSRGGRAIVLLNRDGAIDTSREIVVATPFPATAVAVADFDNDLRPDLVVGGSGGLRLFHQEEDGSFADVSSAAGLAPYPGVVTTVAFVDVDHDGDVDIVAGGVTAAAGGEGVPGPGPFRLLRNNGNGTFTDITTAAGVEAPVASLGVVATDYDNRRDVDLVVVGRDGPPALYRNRRDGTFEDVAAAVGWPRASGWSGVAAGDVNKDEAPDFFFARRDGPGVFSLSNGQGRFRNAPGPLSTEGATAAMILDYDNDGVLDLVTASPDGVRLFRGLGGEWREVTESALPPGWRAGTLDPPGEAPRALAAGDLDGDGDVDLVVRFASGRVEWARNDGGNRHRSVTVRLTGRASNRSGVGAKVEVRAGALRSRAEVHAASPPPAPSDLIFGLGARAAADAVRVLWPAGILQAEILDAAPAASGPLRLDLTELDRKPSSCPYLFTWNGDRFEFVTDFLGGGEMGYWVAPGVRNVPDPDEYVRIRGDQLRARDGRYELRVTNELEEAVFLDRAQLLVVDHPAGTQVFPAEGLTTPPRTGLRLWVVHDLTPARRVRDHRGRDVTERAARLDRRYVDDLPVLPIRGYAAPHALTIDTGADPDVERVVLLLTGWTDYAFSSDNLAAWQAGHVLAPPSLQVRDATGEWRTVIEQIGVPVGRPQTVVVDLSGRWLSSSRDVRLVTSMRVYWDRILVDASGAAAPLDETEVLERRSSGAGAGEVHGVRLDPVAATLAWRGFSAEVSPDGREPFTYDYTRVSPASPWKQMPGRYTREGDVRELLRHADDMFVVSAPGDEVALSFDAGAVPSLPAGRERTFVLAAHGYSKEMDLSSASPDWAWPLPFRAMTAYPYAWPDAYPSTPAHRDYVRRYNTRAIGRMIPPLDVVVSGRDAPSRPGQ
jgi:tetratricopeptide (TPR) repeat protein